jgi:ribulose-phosphate 3-epimerase
MHEWSASLICADLATLKEDLKVLEEGGVNSLHIDVMDGNFVPRLGMYPEMVEKIRMWSNLPIEVHLMIQKPENYIDRFLDAGADRITVHFEVCCSYFKEVLEKIKRGGCQAGIAMNPMTGFEDFCGLFDYVLMMGVDPGIIGQKIKPFMMNKIREFRKILPRDKKIMVDGGVNFMNFSELFDAGADILVGGSQTVFNPSCSLSENLAKLLHYELSV